MKNNKNRSSGMSIFLPWIKKTAQKNAKGPIMKIIFDGTYSPDIKNTGSAKNELIMIS